MDPINTLPPMHPFHNGPLRSLEYFNFPPQADCNIRDDPYSAAAHAYYQPTPPKVSSPDHSSSHLSTLSLKTPPCPLCKGQKFGFTAYFHNTKIFFEPPHELLRFVEKSYYLRDRLTSLLVTYTMHDIEQNRVQAIEKEINAWQQEVLSLVQDVVCSSDFELDFTHLDRAKAWAFEMAKQLKEHTWGGMRLEMPKGRLLVLKKEFRMCWEEVWKGFMVDQRSARDAMNARTSTWVENSGAEFTG